MRPNGLINAENCDRKRHQTAAKIDQTLMPCVEKMLLETWLIVLDRLLHRTWSSLIPEKAISP